MKTIGIKDISVLEDKQYNRESFASSLLIQIKM